MTLDLAFLLALACVAVALATGRLVAALPGLAGELGGDDLSDELMHALERGLVGFRTWVLAAPFCWLVTAWAINHPAPSHALTAVAQGAGLLPIAGLLCSIGAGLWRFSVATSASHAEEGAEAWGRDVAALVLVGLSALAFAVSIGGTIHWIFGLL